MSTRPYMQGADPFFFAGNGTGCLLIHGFTGTPHEMRGLGEFLHARREYTVSGPALAGHATHYSHIAETSWEEWYASVTEAYEELRARCDRVFAIGLSMGGCLALHLAAHRELAGVVAAASPIEVKLAIEPAFRNLPFLFRVVPYLKKSARRSDTQDPEVVKHHPTYDRVSTRAGANLILKFLPHLRADLGEVRVPALLMQAYADRTIPRDSLPRIYAGVGSREKEMVWLERGGHSVFEDLAREEAFERVDRFILAHSGIPLAGNPARVRREQSAPIA